MVNWKVEVKKVKVEINLHKEVNAVIAEAMKTAKKKYEKTVRTWNDKPTFQIVHRKSRYEAEVYTSSLKYKWVDEGTKKHKIRPKTAPALRFNTRFKPKTKFRTLRSIKGFSKPPVAFAQEVNHPGTTARLFTQIITKQTQKKINAGVRRVKKNAVKIKAMS